MLKGRIWQMAAAVVLLALVCACSPGASRGNGASTPPAALTPEQAALAPEGPTLGGQRSGDLLVWLASTPSRPCEGTARMEAILLGIDGQPITDARVTFDVDMTNMSHGLYLVATDPAGDGRYAGDVHYSMPGPWRIIAVIERPTREAVRSRFEFKVGSK